MPTHIKWPHIDQFHNVRSRVLHNEDLKKKSITYKAKIKLHGTNSAIQINPNTNTVIAQSRNNILGFSNDNVGFASWVNSVKTQLLEVITKWCRSNVIIYGEWIGEGIQNGVAACKIGTKYFCVFAVEAFNEYEDLNDETKERFLFVEPKFLEKFIKGIPNTKVIPWFTTEDGNDYTFSVTEDDWEVKTSVLQDNLNQINSFVEQIDKHDPWIEKEFGIVGPGEGLVFYPFSEKNGCIQTYFLNREDFSNLAFKAKGNTHKTVSKKSPASLDPEKVSSAHEYAELVCTPARLEQGVREVCGGEMIFEKKFIGSFLKWINEDLSRETRDELAVSKVEAKMCLNAAMTFARNWYIEKIGAVD